MIWYYDVHLSAIAYLMNHLPFGSFTFTCNSNILHTKTKKNDLVVFFNYRDTELYDTLVNKGVIMYPEPQVTYRLRNRATQLKHLDTISQFPLKRLYIESFNGIPEPLPDLPIMKIGNNHQGIAKYKFPDTHNLILNNESIVYEEFVINHRAIRILFIENNIFIIEHINENSWIKNNNPSNEITFHWDTQKDEITKWLPCAEKLIYDANILINNYIHANLVGIDYAINNDKIGLLEANDMVGIPDYEPAINCYNNLLLKLAKQHLNPKM